MSSWREISPAADEVRRLVGEGYDAMGERFDRWADAAIGSPRDAYVRRLFDLVHPGEAVLEISCGSGARATEALADRYIVTGIDLSTGQIQRARERIPTASFPVGDVTQMEFPAASFRAIVAFYVMNHIPSDAHAAAYRKVATWLDPDGLFIANLPVRGGADGIEEGWLGVPMFFASLDVEQNFRAMQAAGLEIVDSQLISEIEVDPDEGTSEPQEWQWIVAKRGVTS